MAFEVGVTITVGNSEGPTATRVIHVESVVGDMTNDPQGILLEAMRRVESVTEQVKAEVLSQVRAAYEAVRDSEEAKKK